MDYALMEDFLPLWEYAVRQRKRHLLKVFLKWEESLKETVEELKGSLAKANEGLVGRVEEIKKLRKEIAMVGQVMVEGEEEETDSDLEICGGQSPLLIFPVEVWEMILERVPGWEGLLNCWNTCTLFHDLLHRHPSRSTFLFYEVFPHLFRHLSEGKVLGCRLVCPAWNSGVDNLLREHGFQQPHCSAKDSDPLVTPMEENRACKFMAGLFHGPNIPYLRGTSPGRNPFIRREIVLRSSYGFHRVVRFLQACGEHIWYLTMHLVNHRYSGEDVRLLKLVMEDPFQLLPNLRKFRLEGLGSINFPDLTVQGVEVTAGSLATPTLTKLEAIEIDGVANGPVHSIYDNLLLKYHNQLGRLHLAMDDWVLVCHLGWPQLRELHIGKMFGPVEYKRLAGVAANLPSLRKLGLSSAPLRTPTPWPCLLELIDKLVGLCPLSTLQIVGDTVMDLNGRRFGNPFRALGLPPMSPSVTTLIVEHMDEYINGSMTLTSYSFLLHFPFLENLHVFLRRSRDHVGTGTIQLQNFNTPKRQAAYEDLKVKNMLMGEMVEVHQFMYLGQMHKSNLWELLPRLKVFTFQTNVWTREDYERFMRSQPNPEVEEEEEEEGFNLEQLFGEIII